MPDDRNRIASTYSPKGMAEFREAKARYQRLVDARDLTEDEAAALRFFKMNGFQLNGQPVRRPKCQTCGEEQTVIGGMAQTFMCCGTEQSITDAIRSQRAQGS